MIKFNDAKTYIDSLKYQAIHSAIKERKEFKEYLDDESPDNHFKILWIMISSLLDNSSNAVSELKKIYEFTQFTPKYDGIDFFSYLTDKTIVSLYTIIKKNEWSIIYGFHSLVQFLFPQKNTAAFLILKKITTLLVNEISNSNKDSKHVKSPLMSLVEFYSKLEDMKLSIHKPQEITNYIKSLFQFLEQYQASRISSHLTTLPIYFFYKIVKFVSKILNKNPEANPISLIRLSSFHPIILISYRLPDDIPPLNDKILTGLPPLSIFQNYLPCELPQFFIPYYIEVFFTVFEFFVIFAHKPNPSFDPHDLRIIINTFNYVTRYQSGKDAFLLCLYFFRKSNSYVLFRLYGYLRKKEQSIIHDYCVMIFTIAFDCHILTHARSVMKSNHKIYFIQVLSSIEKNYKNSPFKQKVSFIKQILIGENPIPRSMPIIQKYKLILSSNNFEQKKEKIIKLLYDSIKFLNDPDVYVYFCLLIINSIQKVLMKTMFLDQFLAYTAFLIYSHDFYNTPKYHYLQILKFYALDILSNVPNSCRCISSITLFQNPTYFSGFSIIFSRFSPVTTNQVQFISSNSNKIPVNIITTIAGIELPQYLFLLREIIANSVHFYKLSFDVIINYLINVNKLLSLDQPIFITRRTMRMIGVVTSIDGFDKFISNYRDLRQLLLIFHSIGLNYQDDIPATPGFINIWRTIGSNQRTNEDLIASLILLSYKVNKSRFFFEALFPVIINMSNPLIMNLKLDEWEQSPMFTVFIQCLPINLKIYPNLLKLQEQKNNIETQEIEVFKKKVFKPMPLSTLAIGTTGCYFINEMDLVV